MPFIDLEHSQVLINVPQTKFIKAVSGTTGWVLAYDRIAGKWEIRHNHFSDMTVTREATLGGWELYL